MAGGAACDHRFKFRSQHDVRRHFAYGAGDHAHHAGGIRAVSFKAVNHRDRMVRCCAARGCHLERISRFAGHRLKILGLQEVVWVFWATLEGWKHACEHLEPQIFLVA